MSSLSPEPTQPELSGLTTIQASGAWLASGINVVAGAQVSGAVQVSGTVNVSGLITVSGYPGLGPLSGFLFAGFSGAAFLSGAAGFSGAIPVVPVQWDFSGKQWTPFVTAISGSTVQTIWVASGNIIGGVTISGGVTVSGLIGISGGGVTISGGVTVSGLVVVSGFAAVSGLFAGSSGGMKFMSGIQAFSGAIPDTPLVYDFSGAQWVAMNVHYSGGSHVDVNTAKTTAVMGLSGLFSTAASSVPNLSGGVPLSSGVVVSVLIRNWSGNTPLFVGFSGGFPASGGGAGFVLYGGDGLTVEAQNMNLVYVVAQVSGTLISHFGQMY